jgi:DNA-binding MarR family transcriptional regulator
MTDVVTLPTLVLLLARLERLNEAFMSAVCRRHDISPSELRVLAMLRHRVDDGRVSPSQLAEWIVQTSGGLTATLRRLEEAGYVVRVEDPDDGRGRLVQLTDDGAASYEEVFADLVARYGVVFTDLDQDEGLHAVRRMIEAFERHDGTIRTGDWEADVTEEALA